MTKEKLLGIAWAYIEAETPEQKRLYRAVLEISMIGLESAPLDVQDTSKHISERFRLAYESIDDN